jgi:hypothetical protein
LAAQNGRGLPQSRTLMRGSFNPDQFLAKSIFEAALKLVYELGEWPFRKEGPFFGAAWARVSSL